MARLSALAQERTDLTDDDVAWLTALVAEWSLLADLSMSDLVLWLPTWNAAGLVAAAAVRPTTAPTTVPQDVVGTFLPRGADPTLDRAFSVGSPDPTAYPVSRQGRVIAVVARHGSPNPRVAGMLEEVYQHTADDLFAMLVSGDFPTGSARGAELDGPRVGDGLMRLDDHGRVIYASPNAVSALRRLGLAVDVAGRDLRDTLVRLAHRPGPIDEGLSQVSSGHTAGRAQIENAEAALLLQGIPIRVNSRAAGALILIRDVTELRRRERALLSKDATIREIHHRVKNNLQTVAALLRLQARRATSEATRGALVEAEL
ncbi:MAG: histidine kinase N-terminal domain-containing protein, partial [Actinomycetales bacterium]